MKINIRLKAIGKRKPILELHPRIIPDNLTTVEDLIATLVLENVREYNAKPVDAPMFQFLTEEAYADALHIGKVSFNDRKNEKQQDEQQAIDNALQAFRDGIYRVLINETEVQPGEKIQLNEEDILTFIRLTMLAGRKF
ncbi:hypothetical protein [Bacteroides sp. 519]|uniref:hypothetical protein n=1 Tax=Bacteroides sp. 519 TaxID=2302937 RepID=UPI0013D3EDD4|nr:hypothetical protein [Bacteroides sp. 519]NDV59462.1 hypothetical protein [Bacteroides sp. 519]